MTFGTRDNRQVAVCFILLLFSQHGLAFRDKLSEADLNTASHTAFGPTEVNSLNVVKNHINAKQGEVFRSKMQYYKHEVFGECGSITTNCYATRIVVLERGEQPGEAVLKLYKTSPSVLKLYNQGLPLESKPHRIVKVRKDIFTGYGSRGEYAIRVDTSKQRWTRTNLHKFGVNREALNLWAVDDDFSFQFRNQENPTAPLRIVPHNQVKNGENLVSSWTRAMSTVQTMDTCVALGTCFSQCYYVEEHPGKCAPSHFCEYSQKRGFAECNAVTEDAKLAVAWQKTYADGIAQVESLRECLTGCSDKWEETNALVKQLMDQHESMTKHQHKENSPEFAASLEANHASGLMKAIIEVFIYHKKESTGLETALGWNSCNINNEALIWMANAKPGDDEAEGKKNWEQIMKDCPRLADEMTTAGSEAAQVTAMEDKVTSKLKSDEYKAYVAEHGEIDVHKITAFDDGSGSLLETDTRDGICAGLCVMIVSGLVALVILGLVLLLIGRLICWLGTSVISLFYGGTPEKDSTVQGWYLKCSTIMNRIGWSLTIVGLFGLSICWFFICGAAMVCFLTGCGLGNFLQLDGTTMDKPAETLMLDGPSKAASLVEKRSGTTSGEDAFLCFAEFFDPTGLGSGYWLWWDFPEVDISSSYGSYSDEELERWQRKREREAERVFTNEARDHQGSDQGRRL